jgi:short-subunit dehydrogenase
MSNSTSKGTALVTGASRGIGAVYADRLAKRGYDLILVARSEAPLKALTASLASASGRHITPIVADLNNRVDLANVETKLREDSSITMLVNNAGIGAVVPLLNGDIEKMEEMIALNSIALTRLTYAAAPAFVKRGMGTIINISSVVGISPETLNGVYGATKAYVLAFTHSLQHELADKGIRVQAVLPGATATDMWEIAGLPWQKLPPSIVMPVEDMVDAALVGLSRPRAAPSHSASAIPYPRPDTGFRRGVRHDSPKWARSATKRALRNPGTCSLLHAIAFRN